MTRSASTTIVVGLFEDEADARQASRALHRFGLAERQIGVLKPGQSLGGTPEVGEPLAQAASAGDSKELSDVLANLNVPAGEARFYAEEAREGRTLLVVSAEHNADAIRGLVLEHGGYDVRSRGRQLARPEGAGIAGGTGALPIDVTDRWEDVRSRYEMLWQQHYGTSDATWEQIEPVYRYAWAVANDPSRRGRPWLEVEQALRGDWESLTSRPPLSWSDAAGPIRDVWEDVAEEAAQGAEGGADRRIARQGTDQSVPARDLPSADRPR